MIVFITIERTFSNPQFNKQYGGRSIESNDKFDVQWLEEAKPLTYTEDCGSSDPGSIPGCRFPNKMKKKSPLFGKSKTRLPKTKMIEKPVIKLNNKVKTSSIDFKKQITFPEELTPQLAEEIGIHLGDGFLSDKKYEFRLKGNKNEKEYYDNFIKRLYKDLFNLDLRIKEYETTYGFELYSKGLWNFKNKILNIPAGRKENISIPRIIKESSTEIQVAFLRGVFDTDGSVSFTSRNKYQNYYPRITIELKSKTLIYDLAEILKDLGLEPRISKSNRDECWKIDLNGYKKIERYSQLVGWNNPKSIKRIINWKNAYPKLSQGVIV